MVRVARDCDDDVNVSGMRKLYDWVKRDEGKTVLMTGIQTVGSKVWESVMHSYKPTL